MTKDTLEQALKALSFPDLDVVVAQEGRRFTAVVITSHFTPLDEADRQRLVWGHLRQRFTDHELTRLEFVFTNAPGEDVAVESAE